MAAKSFVQTAVVTAMMLALLAGAVQLQAVRERTYPPHESDEESLYLRSGNALRRLTGAYRLMAGPIDSHDPVLRRH